MSDTLQARRPLNCICALCDCGVHNCANYEALAARKEAAAAIGTRPKTKTSQRSQQDDDRQLRQCRRIKAEAPVKGQQQEEDRQLGRQPIRAGSRAETPGASPVDREPKAAQPDAAMETRGKSDGDAEQECRCLGDNERYLASQLGAPTKFKSADELKAVNLDSQRQQQQNLEQLDSELMHVLVTRPEIASKPRDNILFEGDMDLKTTFETSYEALAKMRLDHWRRYQDQQEQQVAIAGDGRARKQPPPATTTARRPPSPGVAVASAPRATDGEQGVSVAKGRRVKATVTTKRAPKVLNKVRADGKSLPPAAASEATGKRVVSSSEQVVAAEVKPATAPGTADDACAPAVTVATKAAQSPRHKPQRRAIEEIVVAPNIDPDLSPIIVYDANMNRLETMGSRRRSKYRPSTSLHTGARGMFGDQEPETDGRQEQQVAERAAKAAPSTRRQPQQHAAQHQVPAAEEKPETPTQSLQRQMAASESRFWSPEINQRTELALNARNLKDSNQADYLTFSEYNLPVDSKRKVRNNVNMHDHIKEQNIVETSNWTELPRDMGLLGGGDEFISSGPLEDEEQQDLLETNRIGADNSENLALIAQQEEADAVEEIQRCTGESFPDKTSTTLINGRTSAGAITSDHNSAATMSKPQSSSEVVCQTRLKRTCQNQNFDIFGNDYSDYSEQKYDRVMSNGSSCVSASPQAKKQYKNLFSESPDFIRTTGKFLYEEAKGLVNGGKPNCHSRQIATTTVEPNELQTGDIIDDHIGEENLPGCRVFKLDDDFEYIGTRLGHRYYTQKHSEFDK